MSLYVCSECGNVENTATSRFWMGSSKCGGCDPELRAGEPGHPIVTAQNRKPPTKPEKGDRLLIRKADNEDYEEVVWPG